MEDRFFVLEKYEAYRLDDVGQKIEIAKKCFISFSARLKGS